MLPSKTRGLMDSERLDVGLLVRNSAVEDKDTWTLRDRG